MKYMRDNLLDEYGILALQDKILEIMVYIDRFCSIYDVEYCLMAGSALGARRHQGFIPWDDDIDIYMSEIDYLKFRDCFIKYGDHNKFYLQEWGMTEYKGRHMITMAKLRMNGTVIQEKAWETWDIHQGIFVDIFILHNCVESRLSQRIQYIWSEAVVLKGLEVRGYIPKNIKDQVMLWGSKLLPRNWILKKGLNYTYKYQGKNTKYCHGFIDTRSFSRAIFPRNIMFPAKYISFETVKLKVPANIDKYLTIQFGHDYMILPPENKRPLNKHSAGWIADSNGGAQNYLDEINLI